MLLLFDAIFFVQYFSISFAQHVPHFQCMWGGEYRSVSPPVRPCKEAFHAHVRIEMGNLLDFSQIVRLLVIIHEPSLGSLSMFLCHLYGLFGDRLEIASRKAVAQYGGAE